MSHLQLRMWAIATITLAFFACAVRLGWAASNPMPADARALIVLLMLAVLNVYSLIIYIIIRPSREKLSNLFFKIWVTVTVTATAAAGVIHFVRFLPSPQCVPPFSPIIAILLLVGGISGYLLVLWVVWSILKAGEKRF